MHVRARIGYCSDAMRSRSLTPLLRFLCAGLLACLGHLACGGSKGTSDHGGADSAPVVFRPGPVTEADLVSLPGNGVGAPVVTSNNPEVFTGEGVLYSSARASAARGGAAFPLSGRIGVYFHHINRAGAPGSFTHVKIVVESPGGATVSARGSAYTQADTGGIAIGHSPDAQVAADWVQGLARTTVPSRAVLGPTAIFDEAVPEASEIDGRFEIDASAPIFVSVVAGNAEGDAPGVVARPGSGAVGREAGVYAHDSFAGSFALRVPASGSVGFRLDTAEQAAKNFPALIADDDSATSAIGLYGDVFDLQLRLAHDGADASTRNVRISLATFARDFGSRAWDGLWVVDGRGVQAQLTATNGSPGCCTTLAEFGLRPGEARTVKLRAMVPGLSSIPEALIIESR